MSDRRTPESDAEEDLAVNFGKDCVVVHVDCSRRLERERNEAREHIKELYIEMDGLFNHISFLQDALCKTREQYRLSSVCRELRSENERLKRIATWPHDADPFTSPDHDNDSKNYP